MTHCDFLWRYFWNGSWFQGLKLSRFDNPIWEPFGNSCERLQNTSYIKVHLFMRRCHFHKSAGILEKQRSIHVCLLNTDQYWSWTHWDCDSPRVTLVNRNARPIINGKNFFSNSRSPRGGSCLSKHLHIAARCSFHGEIKARCKKKSNCIWLSSSASKHRAPLHVGNNHWPPL